MCKDCIESHLTALIEDVKFQVMAPAATSMKFKLMQVKSCKPFKCQEIRVNQAYRTFTFPGKHEKDAKAFAITLRLCDQILSNLRTGKIMTTRDLYYKDVSLFKNQETVVRALEKIGRCLRVPRSYLNIQPSPNGLVAGDLTIVLENGEHQEVKRGNGSTLIPVATILHVSTPSLPKYILIVEKEAVFSYLQNELPEGVVITGRGFPGRATRNLVISLSVAFPQVPIYCLVDSDPHGILIMRNYEFGSTNSVELQVSIPVRYLGISLLEYTEGLVPSTVNDLKVAMSTLKKQWISDPKYHRYKQELQRGLFMGLKGEMNLLDKDQSTRLSTYVRERIQEDLHPSNPGKHLNISAPKLNIYDKRVMIGISRAKRLYNRNFESAKLRKHCSRAKNSSKAMHPRKLLRLDDDENKKTTQY